MQYGDPLPKKVLSDIEWNILSILLEAEPKPIDKEFFTNKFYPICKMLESEYCIGENSNCCIFCGSDNRIFSGVCLVCRKELRTNYRLRVVGRVRKMGLGLSEINPVRECIVCGKTTRWGCYTGTLCRGHYAYYLRHKLDKESDILQYLPREGEHLVEPPLKPSSDRPLLVPSNIKDYMPLLEDTSNK